jgi:hypothetical protein
MFEKRAVSFINPSPVNGLSLPPRDLHVNISDTEY